MGIFAKMIKGKNGQCSSLPFVPHWIKKKKSGWLQKAPEFAPLNEKAEASVGKMTRSAQLPKEQNIK